MYRVMIVDDQNISRQLFEIYVKSSPDFELAFSVPSAAVADIYLLKSGVDLVLMDIFMNDGSNGLSAAAKIKKRFPDTKIIAVTSLPEPSLIERAREIGIESFWFKEADGATILEVMTRTMAGERVYPDEMPKIKIGSAPLESFTERELDVLKLATMGVTNGEIAKRLNVSENTVKAHVRNMLAKTDLKSRTQLAIEARLLGITVIEED